MVKSAFLLGSFILPKYLIKGFEPEKPTQSYKPAKKMILRDQNNGSFSITRNTKQYLAQAQDKKQGQSKLTVNIIEDDDRNIVDLVMKSDQIPKSTYIIMNLTLDFFCLLKD